MPESTVSGAAFSIGLDVGRANAVRAYFDKFSVLPPRSLAVTSTTTVPGPASFETLIRAVAASKADRFVIVVHGHEDGSGLFLPLANRNRNPVGERTTHDRLRRLRAIAARDPARIDPDDRQLLNLRDAEIERLIQHMQTLQAKNIQAIEFRGCNLGRDLRSVKQFRNFFGASSFGAPDLHSFFGLNPVGTGDRIMGNHTSSHKGTTHTYTQRFADKTCHCCIGVNKQRKPVNGHIVADDEATVDKWIQANLQVKATKGRDRRLPVHGLWEIPTVDLDDPDPLAGLRDKPRPIFPLALDAQDRNEYERHIVYSP